MIHAHYVNADVFTSALSVIVSFAILGATDRAMCLWTVKPKKVDEDSPFYQAWMVSFVKAIATLLLLYGVLAVLFILMLE